MHLVCYSKLMVVFAYLPCMILPVTNINDASGMLVVRHPLLFRLPLLLLFTMMLVDPLY